MTNVPDLLGGDSSPSLAASNTTTAASDNIAAALSDPLPTANPVPAATKQTQRGWGHLSSISSIVSSAQTALSSSTDSISQSVANVNLQPLASFTKSISHNLTGKSTLPDKTTASQVLMFRQLLHTKCRPGLRLSRGYEGTVAQRAVLHMPWWERGIEQSKKMVISYDNLITRLWLSGAIMPYEKGGYASIEQQVNISMEQLQLSGNKKGPIDTMINDKGLPPIPHQFWVDRLGFQQDDPVTDFRSGGVLSLAMLVHIVESCPTVHARFVPKQPTQTSAFAPSVNPEMSLEQIITDDASVLPFGITCINVTDMLAKFLMFSKSVDKMDALLSAKPFWKMFIDPNAMLTLQEVSLDLLCDVCVEIGRERRLERLTDDVKKKEEKSFGMTSEKVTVFDFSEIMDRTEKRVRDEVLGAGPQSVDELQAIARRVKSKYLMRIQLKEKHLGKRVLPQKQLSSLLPTKKSTKNVTNTVMGGVGGLSSMWKTSSSNVSEGTGENKNNIGHTEGTTHADNHTIPVAEGVEMQYIDPVQASSEPQQSGDATNSTEKDPLSEAFDLLDSLGGDFSTISADDLDHTDKELLDAMDVKLDPAVAFTIDDDDF